METRVQAGARDKRDSIGRLAVVMQTINMNVRKALPDGVVDWLFARRETKMVMGANGNVDGVGLDRVGHFVTMASAILLSARSDKAGK